MPIRIIATLITMAVFLGGGGLFIYMGYTFHRQGENAFILFYAVGLLIFTCGIRMIYKMIKRRNSDVDMLE